MAKTIERFVKYVTREGDTFDALALGLYNNEMQASDIIAHNPDYCDVLIFDAGVELKLPVFSDQDAPETLPPWRK